ncbi:MAG TPA: NB-ARC domain protein [Gemmatales bacterium]|nr:NB-ARC domain protein [Gemmatales bacterium]HMP60602.1 NB-ARC domain protein [Gemmatales bacterium]
MMRLVSALLLCLTAIVLGLGAALASGQDKKDDKKELFEPLPPIKVVKLARDTPVDFETEIKPIFENKCETCHGGAIQKGKLDMMSVEALLKGGKTGPALVAGKPDESLLIKLAGRTDVPPMPPKDDEPFTPEELALVELWIAQGAKASEGGPVAKAGPKLGKIPPSVQPVLALALSPDKATLAVGRGPTLHLFEAATGKYLRALVQPELKDASGQVLPQAQLDLVHALAFHPQGELLAAAGFQEVILWNVKEGTIVRRFEGFADRVLALDFSPDGKLLAAGGGAPAAEGEWQLFDVTSGEVVAAPKQPHTDAIFGLRFSPDGKMLATAAADKFIKLWDVPGGSFLRSFEGHTHQVLDVGWRADSKLLVSAGADHVIKTWDAAAGEQVRTIGGHGRQITRLAMVGPRPEVLTVCGDTLARLWNVDNGAHLRNFGGNTDYLYALAASSDGTLVAVGGQEGVVRLYNGTNGQVLHTLTVPAGP